MATAQSGLAAEMPSQQARSSGSSMMQLPDETVEYNYQQALASSVEQWTPAAEMQAKHLPSRSRLLALVPALTAVRSQIAAEREITEPKPEQAPLHSGFIDFPLKLLENHRRKGDASELGRVLALAARLRDETDRVIVLGAGGTFLGPKALFEALLSGHHNELPLPARLNRPRFHFTGDDPDTDALQELLDLLENTCIDPDIREERWGVIAVSKSGDGVGANAVLRALRAEAARYYGNQSPRTRQLIVAVTGQRGPWRDLFKADGCADEEILSIPENVGGRFGVFTAAGLLPAATMGLDTRALLLGAAAMTRRFMEEPFERNPVLQFAAVNYLMTEEFQKTGRVIAVWSRKLEALGHWYGHLTAQSLGKQGKGPTPVCVVLPRDQHTRGQLHQEGPRDKLIINFLVRSTRNQPVPVGMAERNEDGLNAVSRKTHADLQKAAHQAANQALRDVARPTTDLVLPILSEHILGQLMQMLMLATIVEGRLMGINPYGEPGLRPYKANLKSALGLA